MRWGLSRLSLNMVRPVTFDHRIISPAHALKLYVLKSAVRLSHDSSQALTAEKDNDIALAICIKADHSNYVLFAFYLVLN